MNTDGTFSAPLCDGPPAIELPLRQAGEYFATTRRRLYLQAPAAFYNPAMGTRTFYFNRALYSDDLTQSAWTKLSTDTIGTGETDPEGRATLCKAKESANTGAHGVSQALTIPSGPVNFGAMAKAGERSFLRLRVNNGTDGDLAIAVFNLSTGALVSGAGTVRALLNGFFWCSVAGTATVANSTIFAELGSGAATFSYAGAAGSGLYLWHLTALPQLAGGPAVLTTAATRGVTCPLIDADSAGISDPISYLVDEGPPDPSLLMQGVARWERIYSRIPKQTVVPSSVIVAKPDIPSTGLSLTPYRQGANPLLTSRLNHLAGPVWSFNGLVAFQPDYSEPAWNLYKRLAVAADGGPTFGAAPTGGTFTLTYRGQTTSALDFDSTAGEVQTALNALSTITALGGCTVTGTYTAGFAVTMAALTTITADISGLTGTAINSFALPRENGYYQTVVIGGGGISSGTFTLTYCGQTTAAIAYNAGPAAIQSALNALSNVTALGGCTVMGQGGTIAGIIGFQVLLTVATLTGNAAGLIPSGEIISSYTAYLSAYVQTVTLAASAQRILTITAHGIQANDSLVILGATATGAVYASTAYLDITAFSIVDANTIALTASAAAPWYAIGSILYVGALRVTNYQAAPVNCACQRITDYYLPGVSPGVATIDQIPVDVSQNDPLEFLRGCVAGPTLNYIVGDLDVWRGPILSRSKSVVRVSDLGVTTINL